MSQIPRGEVIARYPIRKENFHLLSHTNRTPVERLYIDIDGNGQMKTSDQPIGTRGETMSLNREPILAPAPSAFGDYFEFNPDRTMTKDSIGDLDLYTSTIPRMSYERGERKATICTRSQGMYQCYGQTLDKAAKAMNPFRGHPQADMLQWAITGTSATEGAVGDFYLFIPERNAS